MSDLSVTNVEPDDPELVMDFTIEGRVHTIPMRIAQEMYSGGDPGLMPAWVLDEHAVWAMLQDHGVDDVQAVDELWEYITFHTIDGYASAGSSTLPGTEDVDFEWALRRKSAKAPKSSRKSKMRRLNDVGDRIMIISRGEYPSGYPGPAKLAWVDEGTVVDEIVRRGEIFIKARMDDDGSVYTFKSDHGKNKAPGGGTIFDPGISMNVAWIVTHVDGQPAGATDYYELRYLDKPSTSTSVPKTRKAKMRSLNALKRRLMRA